MELARANVILTGGSKGLGPAIADALTARGANLALSARSGDELERVRVRLSRHGTSVVAVPADCTEEADRERLVAEAERQLGPTDVLVNNAGMQEILALADQTEEEIRRQLDLNVVAMLMLSRRVLPGMLERGRGHIVNMGSISGMTIVPFETIYAATKHAVIGFTLSLRSELHDTGVSASVVSPGTVAETGMFAKQLAPRPPRGSGAAAKVEDVARAVVRAVEKDLPEVTVMGALGKVADVGLAVSPRFTQAMYLRNPTHALVERTARENAARRRQD